MKKVVTLVMVVAMLLVLFAGCSGTTSEPSSSTSSAPAATESVAAEAPTEAATEEASATTSTGWDPNEEADKISYEDLDATYGPMPEVPQGLTIGVVLNEASNEYWAQIGQGIQDRCDELGIKCDIQYALTTEGQSDQLSAAETMADLNYDAYIFSPQSDDLLVNITQEIVDKGTPVINDYCMYIANATSFVGALDGEIVKQAGQYAIDLLGGEGKVAIAEGAVASKMNQIRCGGFKDYVEANSNIEVVAELPAEWVAETAMQQTIDLLTTTPDIDLFFCANDNLALGVIEGLRTSDRIGSDDQPYVIAMDGTTAGKDAVREGTLTATYDSEPDVVGKLSVDICVREILGQDIARVVEGPVTQIDSSNIADYE